MLRTVQDFIDAVGSPPIHDDVARMNCKDVGNFGHAGCGWCNVHEKPRFICGCHERHATDYVTVMVMRGERGAQAEELFTEVQRFEADTMLRRLATAFDITTDGPVSPLKVVGANPVDLFDVTFYIEG